MKKLSLLPVVFITLFFAICASATTYYVDVNSTNPSPPFADWSTAATNIQDAIDDATNGDLVLVTNGVYATGGISMDGTITNRVSVNKALTVQSVNGPWVTTIQGTPGFGSVGVRCAWLTNNAELIGFTLRNGSTRLGATSSQGAGVWGASSNRVLVANCIIVSNSAISAGGGAYQATLENCLVSSNWSQSPSAAVSSAILYNCTVVSNSGQYGLYQVAATNCIIDYNTNSSTFNNYGPFVTLSYCCTAPLPAEQGNFTNGPGLFADGVHLNAGSPCISAGTNVVFGTDIFGQPWGNPPSIGCAEWQPAPVVLVPHIQPTGAPAGFTINSAVGGQPPVQMWWLKDGLSIQAGGNFSGTATTTLVATNLTLANAGNYQLVASNTYGVVTSMVATLNMHCVDAAGSNSIPPYSSWATAATNIQDAVSIAGSDDVILVTNGIYSSGGVTIDGVESNRIALNKALLVQSVNGPWVTTIRGGGTTNGTGATRCAWVSDGAALAGFTLTAGATGTNGSTTTTQNGGGVWCTSSNAVVANCVIVSNIAYLNGSAAYQGTFLNSWITSNGGGNVVYKAVLTNCTVVSNASYGVYDCAAVNCILYYNTVNYYVVGSTFSYCCLYPPASGSAPGNFTNAPMLFVDGIHLIQGSRCIHAGTNAYGLDLFGQPWASRPSIGCAEYQSAPVVEAPAVQLTSVPAGFSIGNTAIDGQAPFTYTWLKNGALLQNNGDFSSISSSNLVATKITLADAGSYQLIVSNAYGTATSAVATLTIHCVDANGTNPVPPYSNWSSAATNIQDAINDAAPGEVVLATNGVYGTGGTSMDGAITNRVTLNKALTVTSVNGFSSTIIQGAWDPTLTDGPLAIRCAWLTNGATLAGFTLENGATLANGNGADSQGAGAWCASSNAVVCNCFLSNNFAIYGGGINSGTLYNSLVYFNFAQQGGGAYYSTLNNCTVGANYSTTVFSGMGAGTYDCTVRNSIVVGNYDNYPFGATIDDYNSSGFPLYTYTYSCTDPPIVFGLGNTGNSPLFLDIYHIQINSPCRGTGSTLYSVGTDLDGEAWANPPSMGCAEVVISNLFGPISLNINAVPGTNVLINEFDGLFGVINGRAETLSWAFGDGSKATNVGNNVTHLWSQPGKYNVVLTVYSRTYPNGISKTLPIVVSLPAPAVLQAPTLSGNNFQFNFPAQSEAAYTIQYTTNLTSPVTWQTLETIPFAPPFPIQVNDPIGTNTARFYRVLAY